MSERLPDLPSGLWRHYKGKSYLVLGYGHDADHADRDVVVYVPLYTSPNETGPRIAVRTASTWSEQVCAVTACPQFGSLVEDPEGRCARMQHAKPRFEYVSPTYD